MGKGLIIFLVYFSACTIVLVVLNPMTIEGVGVWILLKSSKDGFIFRKHLIQYGLELKFNLYISSC